MQSASKGGDKAGQTINVFRTGGTVKLPSAPSSNGLGPRLMRSKRTSLVWPDKASPAFRPRLSPNLPAAAPGTPKTATNTNISEELDDDPPYAVGEVYLLALTDGPNGLKAARQPRRPLPCNVWQHPQPVSSDDIAQSVAGRPARTPQPLPRDNWLSRQVAGPEACHHAWYADHRYTHRQSCDLDRRRCRACRADRRHSRASAPSISSAQRFDQPVEYA